MTVSDDTFDGARRFVRQTQFRALMIGCGIGLLLSVWSEPAGYGFLAGLAISLVNFRLMAVDAFGMVTRSPKQARSYIIGRLVLRYGIMFGFLALIATRTSFNVIASFVGVVFIQIILVVTHIIHGLRVSGTVSRG